MLLMISALEHLVDSRPRLIEFFKQTQEEDEAGKRTRMPERVHARQMLGSP